MSNSERWVKDIKEQFIEKDMQMPNKYVLFFKMIHFQIILNL